MHIEAVATGDKFDCPVGVDSTIKIQYKPANTFQQQVRTLAVGLLLRKAPRAAVKYDA